MLMCYWQGSLGAEAAAWRKLHNLESFEIKKKQH